VDFIKMNDKVMDVLGPDLRGVSELNPVARDFVSRTDKCAGPALSRKEKSADQPSKDRLVRSQDLEFVLQHAKAIQEA
jgi:hypothetical protein